MKLLSYILSFFRRHHAQEKPVIATPAISKPAPLGKLSPELILAKARPAALESSPLGKLPPELLLAILSFLPPPSVACLSLCCCALYSILRIQCQRALKDDARTKKDFLRILERDLPKHIICPCCNKLHSMEKARYYLASKIINSFKPSLLPCGMADKADVIGFKIYREFSSILFLMVMKANRQGADTTELLRLLSTTNETSLISAGFAKQRTVSTRIQDNSLLVREQTVFLVPCSQELPLPWYGYFRICTHIRITDISGLYRFGIWVPHANELEKHENKEGIMYCEQCCTEFRVDFKSHGEAGNAMYITRWMDIGEGRDRDDLKFRRRILHHVPTGWINTVYSRGSICTAFEQRPADDFKFDSLSNQHSRDHISKTKLTPWPENKQVRFDHIEQEYEPRQGRFVSLR